MPRQDKPKGSNSNNLKTLPKLKSDITSGTNVCLWNACSTRNKSVELTDYICENDVDIMIIVESWLKDSDDVVIGECTPPGYTFLNMPRDSENCGGGIAMLYKTPLKMLLKPANDDFKFSTFEHACITNMYHQ